VAVNILKYFPSLSSEQASKLEALEQIYRRWNSMINVISRKDMDNFMIHHVLHSLSVSRIVSFTPGTRILDVGTGGGFPGIPLAVIFPESEFTLLDSIGKKIKVVTEVASELKLVNVRPLRGRAEDEHGKYSFVISRAVTGFPAFVGMTLKNIDNREINDLKNGVIYLKGGDLSEESGIYGERLKVWEIRDFFNEPYFETKKILHLTP
jgi:16S rRNA (guanine527-N7)-methyltransferase